MFAVKSGTVFVASDFFGTIKFCVICNEFIQNCRKKEICGRCGYCDKVSCVKCAICCKVHCMECCNSCSPITESPRVVGPPRPTFILHNDLEQDLDSRLTESLVETIADALIYTQLESFAMSS